jgi:hypothetical protein
MRRFLLMFLWSLCVAVICIFPGGCTESIAQSGTAQAGPTQARDPHNWKLYRYDADGFAAEFPSEPKTTVNDSKTGTRYYSSLNNGNLAYFVEIAVLPSDLNKTSQQVFDDYVRGAANATKSQLKSSNAITLSGNPGREFTLENDKLVLQVRLYLVQKRLYQVLVAVTRDMIGAAETDHFRRGFQLL